MPHWFEMTMALITVATFLYGVFSIKGGIKDFKASVDKLSSKVDHWIEQFSSETDSLRDRITRQEAKCEERSKLEVCKYQPGKKKNERRR